MRFCYIYNSEKPRQLNQELVMERPKFQGEKCLNIANSFYACHVNIGVCRKKCKQRKQRKASVTLVNFAGQDFTRIIACALHTFEWKQPPYRNCTLSKF